MSFEHDDFNDSAEIGELACCDRFMYHGVHEPGCPDLEQGSEASPLSESVDAPADRARREEPKKLPHSAETIRSALFSIAADLRHRARKEREYGSPTTLIYNMIAGAAVPVETAAISYEIAAAAICLAAESGEVEDRIE